MKIGRNIPRASQDGYLDGQMLVAMPTMEDDRFRRAVIYVCAHSEEGAMGIVVNRPAADLEFAELLVQLEIVSSDSDIRLPEHEPINVLQGGPVESGRGFVLHSPDFFIDNSTLPISEDICLTVTVDILRAIAQGQGPASAALALGYAGWGAGQLEAEIQGNGWLTCEPDHDLVFGTETDAKYDRALRKIGIDPGMLSIEAGHA